MEEDSLRAVDTPWKPPPVHVSAGQEGHGGGTRGRLTLEDGDEFWLCPTCWTRAQHDSAILIKFYFHTFLFCLFYIRVRTQERAEHTCTDVHDKSPVPGSAVFSPDAIVPWRRVQEVYGDDDVATPLLR